MNYPRGPKSGWHRQAEAIADGRIELPPDQLAILLEWLQDANWPGATTIADFLASKPEYMVEPVRCVLRSEDHIWAYWTLLLLVDRFPAALCISLREDLLRIAYHYDEDGAHVVALAISAKHILDDRATLRQAAMVKSCNDADHREEYERIVAILSD